MGGDIYNRVVGLSVSEATNGAPTIPLLQVNDLRVAFTVTRSLERQVNNAQIQVYNLSEKSRGYFTGQDLVVELVAGYEDTAEVLFFGDVRFVVHEKQGESWVTTITAGDGEKGIRESRISESFAEGAALQQIIDKVGAQFGGGINAADALAKLKASTPAERESVLFSIIQMFKGYTASGSVAEEFDKLMKSSGKTWSIQSGKLQILAENETTTDPAVILSPSAGLIGNVSGGSDGLITCTSKLQPTLVPGRGVELTGGEFTSALCRIERVQHNGDIRATNWVSNLELKNIGVLI